MINRMQEKYTIVANEILDNKELSLGAKGLYSFLLSKPSTWKFSYKGLISQLKEGEKTIRRFIKELVEIRVLIRIPLREENGLFKGWLWILHPTKEDLENYKDPTQNGTTKTGTTENGTSKNGTSKKGTSLVITNTSNTKEENINIKEKKEKRNDLLSQELLNSSRYFELKKKLGVTDEFTEAIMRYRKEIKYPLKTTRGVLTLLSDILRCVTQHKETPYSVLEIMMNNEWRTIKPEYNCFDKKNKGKVNPIEQGKQILDNWYKKQGGNYEME